MLGSTSDPKWTAEDRLLAQAWSLDRAAKCRGCGMYLDETVGVDGWHHVKQITCDGCRALDKHQEEQKKREPGVKDYVEKVT